jgi:hypothetical protein
MAKFIESLTKRTCIDVENKSDFEVQIITSDTFNTIYQQKTKNTKNKLQNDIYADFVCELATS